jgi:hypothetical protein
MTCSTIDPNELAAALARYAPGTAVVILSVPLRARAPVGEQLSAWKPTIAADAIGNDAIGNDAISPDELMGLLNAAR